MYKKIMLIGVGWEQLPLVYKAKEKGLYVVATTNWGGEIPADKVYSADSRDLERLEEIFLAEKPDAVLADECDYSMYAVAYLTEKYKLPGPSLHTLTITNNKFLQRECASQCGLLQPEYQLCWSREQAGQFARKHGWPIVVKPVDNRGSIGVCVVRSEEELRAAWFKAVKNSHSRLVIAEQYIEGETIIVDGYCDVEGFTYLCSATKDHYPGTPTVAKRVYYPGVLTTAQNMMLEDISAKIVAGTGADFGYVHIEYILEKETGKPWFIEMANRGGGVFISNTILPYIRDMDLLDHYIEQSLGAKMPLDLPVTEKKVLMAFLSPQGNGNIMSLVKENSDSILAAHFNNGEADIESEVNNAQDRGGAILISGSDFARMTELAETIERLSGCATSEYTYLKRFM